MEGVEVVFHQAVIGLELDAATCTEAAVVGQPNFFAQADVDRRGHGSNLLDWLKGRIAGDAGPQQEQERKKPPSRPLEELEAKDG